ncbi:hypothetical protein LSAT2_014595 [Lamellibrachia satsuma]|nr:hypothetical protein LSAT2_014595 [Lamellibrachia satsuma]
MVVCVGRTVILQAENDRERDEWVATINNVMEESGYVKEKPRKKDVGSSKTSSHSNRNSPEKVKEPHRTVPVGAAAPSPVIPPSVADAIFIPDAPIQFDMISPSDESVQSSDFDGPQSLHQDLNSWLTARQLAWRGGASGIPSVFTYEEESDYCLSWTHL